jgi:AcrR family transcriptional regulator
MTEPVKGTRRYDSPRRREQAAETRRQILSSAQALFERGGFAGTSMAAIASTAGVSLKTVYLAFETKSGLLRALWHVLLRGDDDGVPVGDQRWFREVLEEPDPVRQLRLNMRNSRIVKVRAGAMLEVIRTAAALDPDVAVLWQRIEREFYGNQHAVVESLAAKGALAPGLDVDRAADILWTLNHPAVFALLAGQRDWPAERFEKWIGDVLCSQLLVPPP